MHLTEKNKLMREYVKKYSTIFRILEMTGFCRFIIRNNKIIERTGASKLYNIFVMILIDTNALIMLWTSNSTKESLSPVELGTIINFAIFSTVILYHITFGAKNGGPDLIQNCINLDCYLDPKETEFMRNRTFKIFTSAVVLVGIIQVGAVAYLYYLFNVSITIHIVGSTYFFWIFFAYNDYSFFFYLYWFLITRVRYLNVALLKITNINMEFIPKQWFLSKLFWDEEYDDRVTFHIRNKEFSVAFKMLFNQLRCIERVYSLNITMSFYIVIIGSFVTVQTFIMYIKASTEMTRASVITSWVILTWFYVLFMTSFADMFYNQIEHTKLICAYIQLDPTSPEALLKLTKDVLTALDLKYARVSPYNLFDLDTSFLLKVAASTAVYITVQLQLAFPNLEDGHKIENVTRTKFQLDNNKVKEFLFLY